MIYVLAWVWNSSTAKLGSNASLIEIVQDLLDSGLIFFQEWGGGGGSKSNMCIFRGDLLVHSSPETPEPSGGWYTPMCPRAA